MSVRGLQTDATPGVRVTPPRREGLRVTSSFVDPKRLTRSRWTKVRLGVADARRCETLQRRGGGGADAFWAALRASDDVWGSKAGGPFRCRDRQPTALGILGTAGLRFPSRGTRGDIHLEALRLNLPALPDIRKNKQKNYVLYKARRVTLATPSCSRAGQWPRNTLDLRCLQSPAGS